MAINTLKNPIIFTKTVNAIAVLALLTHIFQPQLVLAEDIESALPKIAPATETLLKESEEGNMFPVSQPNQVVSAVITAYTSTPGQTDDTPFIAATGLRVHDGMIAANWLPFGTIVKIPALYGDKKFIVEDRMNARYGYGRLDIWLDTTRSEARKFGVKRVEVEVYLPVRELARAR